MVALLVLRRINERDVALASNRDKLRQSRIIPQLGAVPFLEFRPLLRVVPKPLAELRRRRDFPEPAIGLSILLRQAAGPEAVNQNPSAVGGRWMVIHTVCPDAHCSAISYRRPVQRLLLG